MTPEPGESVQNRWEMPHLGVKWSYPCPLSCLVSAWVTCTLSDYRSITNKNPPLKLRIITRHFPAGQEARSASAFPGLRFRASSPSEVTTWTWRHSLKPSFYGHPQPADTIIAIGHVFVNLTQKIRPNGVPKLVPNIPVLKDYCLLVLSVLHRFVNIAYNHCIHAKISMSTT